MPKRLGQKPVVCLPSLSDWLILDSLKSDSLLRHRLLDLCKFFISDLNYFVLAVEPALYKHWRVNQLF